MSWSDEGWKQWRKAAGQQASSSGAQGQQQQQQQHASPAMPGIGSCAIVLPAIWKVDVNPSESHRQKDFAKVRRDCNWQLQKMYNVWQQELEEKREEHSVELCASVANQTTANNLLLEEKQRTAWLGQQVIDLEAKLVQAQTEQKGGQQVAGLHQGEQQKLQMEYESRRLRDQSDFEKAKKELETDADAEAGRPAHRGAASAARQACREDLCFGGKAFCREERAAFKALRREEAAAFSPQSRGVADEGGKATDEVRREAVQQEGH